MQSFQVEVWTRKRDKYGSATVICTHVERGFRTRSEALAYARSQGEITEQAITYGIAKAESRRESC